VVKKPRTTARDVLYELKWRKGKGLSRAEIWFADRTRAEEHKIIKGEEITELGRGYFLAGGSMLPYYKILRIVYGGEVLFERQESERKTPK
jgi:uncharacterized protein (UPF0248 family)